MTLSTNFLIGTCPLRSLKMWASCKRVRAERTMRAARAAWWRCPAIIACSSRDSITNSSSAAHMALIPAKANTYSHFRIQGVFW